MLEIGFSVSTGHRNRPDYKGVLMKKLALRSAFAFSVFLAAFNASALVAGQDPSVDSQASIKQNYYGAKFYNSVLGQARDEKLKLELKTILKSAHVQNANNPDQLVPTCESQKNCVTQTSIGYDGARKFIFGKFYLVKVDSSNYGIKEMYCDRIYQGADFKSGSAPGPGVVPDNAIINVEHTWPQSKFSGKYPKELQKADMHHLYPTDSQMNSIRGNHIFGEVQKDGQHRFFCR